jgi:hypothetical protein
MRQIQTPIANIAVAYDDPNTQSTFILIFNQVLSVPDLDHNLISPFQLRVNSIIINETPLMTLADHQPLDTIPPTSHSIMITEPELLIPLRLSGIMSYFDTRRPTAYELIL